MYNIFSALWDQIIGGQLMVSFDYQDLTLAPARADGMTIARTN